MDLEQNLKISNTTEDMQERKKNTTKCCKSLKSSDKIRSCKMF